VRSVPIRDGTDRVRTTVEEVGSSMAAKEGYCVKCKAKREMKDPVAITMKNGRPATQGTCPSCGTKMFKIGK
jgi:RNase P subunit RPR2